MDGPTCPLVYTDYMLCCSCLVTQRGNHARGEEEQGDLFAGEEGPQTKPRPIAVEVDQFFSLLFASRMDDLLKGAMVVLLTCGCLVKHKQSFQDLHSSLCQ
ncbi:hypothetical protein PAXRUDRAFT_22347 [Paxillus rubicundulus Ve08.2h10]|uniref:Uncharacterized protein n=1 Tax=Paxillus rubicundulus Ve08.2h10 TaxID=930991 RepID=A0A0D0CXL8_9AGAM|nr:hypothetical protein PAXRUDRAFT_22347 [Paxillus rubicundulus Ve08.2h10]